MISPGTLARLRDDTPNIDDGTCTACNLPVVYEEGRDDWDETCVRSKPYCTKPDDERVDWRASCLHATKCALDAERMLEDVRAQLAAVSAARDEACEHWEAHLNGAIKRAIGGEDGGYRMERARIAQLRAAGSTEGGK